jgi:hypothetical protein
MFVAVEESGQAVLSFDAGATQAVSASEVVGEIEERMALDKLTER